MSFHGFLCDSMPTPLVGFRRFLFYDYFSVVSRRFYASVIYIMSQSPHSYFRIDTLSPSASTIRTIESRPAEPLTPVYSQGEQTGRRANRPGRYGGE